jgi:hypothetical protein
MNRFEVVYSWVAQCPNDFNFQSNLEAWSEWDRDSINQIKCPEYKFYYNFKCGVRRDKMT